MPSTKNKVRPQNISHEHELDSKGVYALEYSSMFMRQLGIIK